MVITRAADHYVVRPDPAPCAPTYIDVPIGGAPVLIMRDDTAQLVEELGGRLARRSAMPPGALAPALAESYRGFQRDMRNAFRCVVRRPGHLAFHVIDARRLELAVRSRAGSGPLISLDPLVERAARPFRVSRGFLLGGRRQIGLVPRPGADPIGGQITSMLGYAAGKACTLIEDDICTGRTITRVIRLLRAAGIPVRRVVPGIRLEAAAEPGALEAGIESVLCYRTVPDTWGESAMELTDPRNYLFGLSGLVVRLPDGSWGRAPYWLPFVRTSARVGIGVPADAEKEFAFLMLEANLRFFARAERLVRRTIQVADLDPAVRQLVLSLEIAGPLESVRSVLDKLMTEMDHWIELIAQLEDCGVDRLAVPAR
jgi:hypothetical protein